MKTVSALRLTAIVVCAAALCCGGIAYAITSTVFQYSSPQTGYFSLNPMAFSPARSSDASSYTIHWPDYIDPGAVGDCFVTGLNLPDGAQVKAFTMWSASGSGSGTGSVQAIFWRSNVATGANSSISIAERPDTSGRISTAGSTPSGQPAIINNQHFSYGVSVCFPNVTSARFYSARITYTYNNAGD